jgi:L-arabinose transport system permease protein
VISACVLGGVSLSGGVATIAGVVIGVFIMGAAQNALNLLDVPTFYQYVVRGGILLAAVIFDRLRQSGGLRGAFPSHFLRPAARQQDSKVS